MLLIIINVQLFSKIDWKILPPMIFALKFFYTVTIRWSYPRPTRAQWECKIFPNGNTIKIASIKYNLLASSFHQILHSRKFQICSVTQTGIYILPVIKWPFASYVSLWHKIVKGLHTIFCNWGRWLGPTYPNVYTPGSREWHT